MGNFTPISGVKSLVIPGFLAYFVLAGRNGNERGKGRLRVSKIPSFRSARLSLSGVFSRPWGFPPIFFRPNISYITGFSCPPEWGLFTNGSRHSGSSSGRRWTCKSAGKSGTLQTSPRAGRIHPRFRKLQQGIVPQFLSYPIWGPQRIWDWAFCWPKKVDGSKKWRIAAYVFFICCFAISFYQAIEESARSAARGESFKICWEDDDSWCPSPGKRKHWRWKCHGKRNGR